MAYLVAVAISILRANGPTWLDRNLFCFILADCPIVCNELRIKNSDFWFYLVGRFLDPPVYPGWQQSEKEIKNFYFQIKRFDIGWVFNRLTNYSYSILCGWNFLPFSPKPVFFAARFGLSPFAHPFWPKSGQTLRPSISGSWTSYELGFWQWKARCFLSSPLQSHYSVNFSSDRDLCRTGEG